MYSKSKGMHTHEYSLTPPPGYDGSRFRRRSDGRDDSFPIYPEDPQIYRQPRKPEEDPIRHPREPACSEDKDIPPCEYSESDALPCSVGEKKERCDSGITAFIESLKNEDLLLIALIVLLCTRDGGQGLDTILILALLLCT